MRVDLVTGTAVPHYTAELASHLSARVDLRLLRMKAYSPNWPGRLYSLIDSRAFLRKEVREASILHVDSQRLAYALTARIRNPKLVVCYDVLTFENKFPDPSYEKERTGGSRLWRGMLLLWLQLADTIVCPSEFSRKELATLAPKSGAKIKVIPMGVDLAKFIPRDKQSCRRRLGLPETRRIILVVGTESPRKNLSRLLHAFAQTSDQTGAYLVKIGSKREPLRSTLTAEAHYLGVSDSVAFVDYASPDDLPLFYGAADLLVQPSLYEGFGIPPLEALASGTPVAASDIPSLREVLTDAARFFNPLDQGDMADTITEVLSNESLRTELRSKGLDRARAYPWSSCIASYAQVYESLIRDWRD